MFNFGKIGQLPGQLGQYKQIMDQMKTMQKAMEALVTEIEEDGVKVVIRGGGLMSGPKVETLEYPEEKKHKLTEVLNKALKKSHEVATKKLQEMGGGLGGMM